MIPILVLLGIYACMLVIYPLITILHELGHAFAYLVLTKPDRVDIFIGSYGDTDTRLNFNLKKLHFYVKVKFPYIRIGGMCRSSKAESNYLKRIIILLAGPMFTFFVALLLVGIAFDTDAHGAIKVFCFILIVLSTLSLISNLAPSTIAGTNIDSDGKQLAFVMRTRKLYGNYINGLSHFNNDEHELSTAEFLKVYERAPKNQLLLRCLYTSCMALKDYAGAEKYLYGLKQIGALNLSDYLSRGYMFSLTGRPDLALADYRKVLRGDQNNVYALNNIGYHLSLDGEYEEAHQLIEKAIKLQPEFAYSYSNLGYVKIMTGWLNQGKVLIEKSLELDPDNAYAYKHLGIYYLKVGNKQMALLNLNKAVQMDEAVDIEAFIAEAELL